MDHCVMPKIKNHFRLFLSVLIFLAVVGFSSYYHAELINTLLLINPRWMSIGLICYGINYILRALRLRVLSDSRIPFWPDAVYASSLHGFITYLIPMQLGDASLPVIVKSTNDIELTEGTAILVRIRLLDMMSLGGMMIIAAIFYRLSLPIAFRWVWFASGGILFLFPLVLRRFVSIKYFQSVRFGQFFKFFSQAGKFHVAESFLSFGIWIAVSCVFFCVMQAVNLPLGFDGALLLISLQLPLQVFPVQGFANTGNHEGGWIAALSLLGIPLGQAAEFALVSHVIIFIYVLVLGIVPLIVIPFKKVWQ